MSSVRMILLTVLILSIALGHPTHGFLDVDTSLERLSVGTEGEAQTHFQYYFDRTHIINQEYTPHDPIVINTVEQFQSQGWPGDGTQENPYRISNISITYQPGIAETLIAIYNVPAHFVVEYCQLIGMRNYGMRGIGLINVRNGIVRSCDFSSTGTALTLQNSEYNLVANNTITDSDVAVYLSQSTDNVIRGNYFETYYQGLIVTNLDTVTVEDNQFLEPQGDIYTGPRMEVMDSSNVHIIGCTMTGSFFFEIWNSDDCFIDSTTMDGDGEVGFRLYYSERWTISNSTLVQSSVRIRGDTLEEWNHQFQNVTLNGRLVGYYFGVNDAILDASQFSQLFFIDSSRIAVQGSNDSSSMITILFIHSNDIDVHNVTLQNYDRGIEIESCQDVAFVNIFVNCSWNPVSIMDSSNISFSKCQLLSEYYGTSIYDTDEFQFRNGTVTAEWDALYLYNSSFATISDSTLRSNGSVLSFYELSNCTIARNEIIGWYSHFRIEDSLHFTVVDNRLWDVFFWLLGPILEGWIHDFQGNSVNGKPYAYFRGLSDTLIEVDEFGQVTLVECDGVTLTGGQSSIYSSSITIAFSENCVVKDLDIDYWSDYPILIVSSENCTVDGITLLESWSPVFVWQGLGITIANSEFQSQNMWVSIFVVNSFYCEISNNSLFSGIDIHDSARIEVTGNYIAGGSEGINIWNSQYLEVSYNVVNDAWRGVNIGGSAHATVLGNEMSYCQTGVVIDWSSNITVMDNVIQYSRGSGLYAWESSECIISSNVITHGQEEGIFLDASNLFNVTWNVVVFNDVGGITLRSGSWDNYVYGNLVSENGNFQGYDEGSDNVWHDGISIGNCWSPLTEPEVSIDGGAGSTDIHPLHIEAVTDTLPLLSSMFDITFVVGNVSRPTIHWVIWTVESGSYTIWLDGLPIDSDEVEFSCAIHVPIPELGLGAHNFTILFSDNTGSQISDTILVHVVLVDANTAVSIVTVISTASIVVVLIARELPQIRRRLLERRSGLAE
ncbi:MAG: right-handed parallel beta-helix repeat-containing protein [Candidatus Thorarchaeota archaeon]|nr:MAG: right-handed parallel beta-helix repeat-containing protein [Candidatus Thorarchaeota archaeon]